MFETVVHSSMAKMNTIDDSTCDNDSCEESKCTSPEGCKSTAPDFSEHATSTPSTLAADEPYNIIDLTTPTQQLSYPISDSTKSATSSSTSRSDSPLKDGETMLSLTRGRPRPRLTSPIVSEARRSSCLFGQISPPAIPHQCEANGGLHLCGTRSSTASLSPSSSSSHFSPPPRLQDFINDRATESTKTKTIPSPTGSDSFSAEVEFPVFSSFQQIVGSMMKSVSEGERLGPGRGVTLQDFFDAAEAVGHVMLATSSAPPSRINSAGPTCPSVRSNAARRGSLNNRSSFLGVKPPISPEGQRRASWVGGMRNRSGSEYNRSRCCSATSIDCNQDEEEAAQFPLPCRARSYNAGISTGSPALGSRTPGSLSRLHPNRRRMPGALQRLTDSVTNGNMRLIVTDDTTDDEGSSTINCTAESTAVTPVDGNDEVPANVRGSGKSGASRSRKSSLIDLGALLCRPRRNSRVACFADAHPPSPPTLASADVDFGNLIGSGSFGDVFKAKCKLSGEFIAVKVVSYEEGDKASEVAAKQLANEMDILQQLEHPNIIRYLGHEFIPPNVEWDPLPRDPAMHHRLLQHKCSMGRLLVFTEYMFGGSVKSALNDFGPFEEAQIANYSYQILSGLEYLHRKSVSHRDLKCDNLLLDAYGTVKLGDFGSSRHISSSALMTQLSGSIPWMAPEVISAGDSKGYSISADIWSFGIVVIEMATGTHPWGKLENPIMAIYKILSIKTVDPPRGASPDLVEFLNACLQYEPSQRATCSELLRQPFLAATP